MHTELVRSACLRGEHFSDFTEAILQQCQRHYWHE